MGLDEAVRILESELSKLKEVVRSDFEIRLRNQTGKKELKVGNLDAYDWKRDSPFMTINFGNSTLGYIFPVQKTAYLFHNTTYALITAPSLIESLSRTFLDSGYESYIKDMWQEAYSVVQYEERFKPKESLVLTC